MKKLSLVISILTWASFIYAQEKGIQFNQFNNWAEVLQKAKKENKYLFVDAYATWCGPCKQMDREVFTDQQVGDFYNDQFIAVKVQMDSTKNDNAFVKGWYPDARMLIDSYAITGYPTYLFFSPDGEIVHRGMGAQAQEQFVALGREAQDPATQLYGQLIAWKAGRVKPSRLPELYESFKRVDKALADSFAIAYRDYLRTVPVDSLLNKTSLAFTGNRADLFTTNDQVFQLVFDHPEIGDSLIYPGWSLKMVNYLIGMEKVRRPALASNNPQWDLYQEEIKKSWPRANARLIVLTQKCNIFQEKGDWAAYTRSWSEFLELTPPDPSTKGDVFMKLNMTAWTVFQHATSRPALEKALEWSERSIALMPNPKDHYQFLDTRANLLHKLGKTEQAIAQQRMAIKTAEDLYKDSGNGQSIIDEYKSNLSKMKNGEKTW